MMIRSATLLTRLLLALLLLRAAPLAAQPYTLAPPPYQTVLNNTGAPVITFPDTLLLPAATLCGSPIGQSYSLPGDGLTAVGGTPPYTWSLVNGTLPPSLISTVVR